MTKRHYVVILLAPGESLRPARLVCANAFCRRTMMTVNRDISLVLDKNKGIHWTDIPENVTSLEHKCRGCEYYYKIYTPENIKAVAELNTVIEANKVVKLKGKASSR